jgi:hypothetical protein
LTYLRAKPDSPPLTARHTGERGRDKPAPDTHRERHMQMKHNGSFETPEGSYGGEFDLDGMPINVVTVFTGPGLGADTEIEAERPLTEDEQQAVLDAETYIDHTNAKQVPYTQREVQHRF